MIDYTTEWRGTPYHTGHVLAAHGEGRVFYGLVELAHPEKYLRIRFDGKPASYVLAQFYLTRECQDIGDGAFACVQCDDYEYWTFTELKRAKVLRGTKSHPRLTRRAKANLIKML